MAQKIIAVDLDGTVCDLMTPWVAAYERQFARPMVPPARWEFLDDLDDDERAFMVAHLETPGLFESLESYPGAIDGVRRLLRDGHRALIVTSPAGPNSVIGKYAWCSDHLPGVPVVMLREKHLLKYDAIVDDHAMHARLATATGRAAYGLRWDYNAHQASCWTRLLAPEDAWDIIPRLVREL